MKHFENSIFQDDKKFQFNICWTKKDLKGISFELFNINESNYSKYIDFSKDYIQNSLEIISFSFKIKNVNKYIMELWENYFKIFLSKFEAIFLLHCKLEISYYIRKEEDKISIDFINNKSNYFRLFLFTDLNILFKTDANFYYLLNSPEDSIKSLLQFILHIDGEVRGAKFLLTSIIDFLNQINLNDKKKLRNLKEFIGILSLLKSFISFSLNLEINYDDLMKNNEWIKTLGYYFSQFAQIIQYFFKFYYIRAIKQFGFINEYKSFDLDECSINIFFPKEKKWFTTILKFPGLSEYFNKNL